MLMARAGSGEEAPVGFNPRKAPRYGVALFSDPDVAAAGWACSADGEPFHFTAPHDLDTDIVWVSNLSWSEFRNKGKTFNHLRGEDYLVSTIKKIAENLGYRTVGSLSEEACKELAKVVQRTIITAIHVYDWQAPEADLKSDTLSDDIRRSIQMPPAAARHLRAPLLGAFQSSSKPEWPDYYDPNTISVTLRQNRLDYSMKVLSTEVPDEAWSYVPPEQSERLTIDRLLDPAEPCLVEASVELSSLNPDLAALVAFGTTPQRRNAALRKWISQPELAWLTRHANVRVNSAFVSRRAMRLPVESRLPAALTSDPLFSLSLSAGLVADAHVQALCSPTYNSVARTTVHTSWGIWLRAVDRALSFQMAYAAYKAGFRVYNYGRGAVALSCDKSRLPQLLDFAEDNGFTHPVFYPLFKEHGFV